MAVISLAIFNNSCEKENIEKQEQILIAKETRIISDAEIMNYLPEVKDGRLVFNDQDSYKIYEHWLFNNQANRNKIIDVNHSIGFICMNEIYYNGIRILDSIENYTCEYIESYPNVFYTEELDSAIIQDIQAPYILSFVLNEDGIYQIGNEIIRVSDDYEYIIKNGDENLITLISKQTNGDIENPNISVIKTAPQNLRDTYTQYSYRTNYFNDNERRIVSRLKRRIHYENNDTTVLFSAHTNAQKKIAGIWIGAKLSKKYSLVKVYCNQQPYYWYNNNIYYIAGGTFTDTQTAKGTFCSMPYTHYIQIQPFYPNSYAYTTHMGSDNIETKFIYYSNSFNGEY